MSKPTLIAVLAFSILTGCGTEVAIVAPPATASANVERLAEWLSGDFSSASQSRTDSAYQDIELHATRIWPSREGVRWLYVEQARSDAPDQPYRQRAYKVHSGTDGYLAVDIYEFPPGNLPPAGSHRDPTWFNQVDPMFLIPLAGCTMHVMIDSKTRFSGETRGKGCVSSLQDVDYLTIHTVITADEIQSWDRGWKTDGTLALGNPDGPYVFKRIRR